jgi:hypothetical protein
VTPNERVVATAARYIGVRENPLGSNRGPIIDKWERHWGMQGQPWCGMACSAWLREAGVTDVSHPATWIICSRGREKGWVTNRPVPGALIVWCGTHVGILVSEVSPGVWNTIEGNTSDMVARRVRSLAGATLVVSPELRHAQPSVVREFYLEDPKVTPKLYGPWRTKAGREKAIKSLSPANQRLARRVRVGGKYGFTIGRRVYGPWLDKDGRDKAALVLERRLGRQLRPFSRVRTTTGVSAAPQALGNTF